MSKEEQDKYIADHYEKETQLALCRATGVPTGSIGYRIYRLKRDGLIAQDAQPPRYSHSLPQAGEDGAEEKGGEQETAPPASIQAACQVGKHTNWWTGTDAVIEEKYPHFFLDGAHAPSKHPAEWQVCMDCGYAEQIRPKYPWDKGVSVVIIPSTDDFQYPNRMIASGHQPAAAPGPDVPLPQKIEVTHEELEVIDEPGSEVVGDVLLESDGDPGDEQPVNWVTGTLLPEPWASMYAHLRANVPQPPLFLEAIIVGLQEALEKTRAELDVARMTTRYWRLQVELAEAESEIKDLEVTVADMRAEIYAVGRELSGLAA
jgi:hypothetical protein